MKKIIAPILFLLFAFTTKAQNIGIGTNTPDPSAKLEVSSNNSGFLPPRMTTTERNGIVNPAVGLQVYNTTTHCLEIFDFGKWNAVYCVPNSTTSGDSTLVTDIDGNTYPTVKICDQTWMAKNLDVARYRNGDIIPQVTDPTQWANLTTGAWCWYNNDSATYGSVYGRLYNWYAVNDPRGLPPQGWHVPFDVEWNPITNCLGGSSVAGGKMKVAGTTQWNSPNIGATNISGFTGLPAGFRNFDGNFGHIGHIGVWWSSTGSNATDSWNTSLYSDFSDIIRATNGSKNCGYSVRCVKDTPMTTLNNGLVAYYPFNGNANDESGNGNNGTVNGATLTTDRFGNSGKAYSFDGVDNFIDLGDLTYINSGTPNEFSVSIWVNLNQLNYESSMIFGDEISQNNGILFQVHNTLGFGTYTAGSNGWYCNILPTLNTWINYTVVQKNLGQYLYINGVLWGQLTTILNNEVSNSVRIGLFTGCSGACQRPLNGKLDDIHVYNRALTQTEITYLATH